jgi:hypothetical protein
MKIKTYITLILTLMFSCKTETNQNENFTTFLNTIPELQLPFAANSYADLQTKVQIDTTFNKYNDIYANGIYGKIKINDSIHAIIYLLAGDNVFPKIVTYNKQGAKIAEQILVNLPGGSDGYNGNGSSFLTLSKDLEIQIVDTTNSFDRDSSDIIIEKSRTTEITIEKYSIKSNGKILMK